MTSVEVPRSVARALPELSVLDITDDVVEAVAAAPLTSGIAYVSAASERSLVRVNERESGIFRDVGQLLERLVPFSTRQRVRMLSMLLGPRTEQVPFVEGRLCLGQWQRVLLVSLDESGAGDWTLTVVG